METDGGVPGEQQRVVRIGAVDMGSNTTRLIIADVWKDASGALRHRPVSRTTTITRLAEGVDTRRLLLPEPITRTRNALVEYRRLAQQAGAVFVLVGATSAVRDADNGEAFLGEIEHDFGFRCELLDGGQEAETTWRGVTSDPALAREATYGTGLLVDIGGGSTEILLTSVGSVVDRHSFQTGSVRLTEQLLSSEDPPAADALEAARDRVLEMLAERFPAPPHAIQVAIAVAGTATTAVAVRDGVDPWDPDRVHGVNVSPQDVRAVLHQLAAVDTQARMVVPGVEAERAAVIVAGLVILDAVISHFALEFVTVSVRDILDGIALHAGQIALDEGVAAMPDAFGRTSC